MKNVLSALSVLFLFVVMALYGWSIIERQSDTFKNVDWGLIVQFLIFGALPGLLTILGIVWFVGFLLKISRKLDD